MPEEKTTDVQAKPEVEQEVQQEFEEKTVVDPIEKSFGNPDKAEKKVRVKKEKPEIKLEPKPEVKPEEEKPDAKLQAEKPAEPVAEKQEKKIETPITKAEDWSDPLDTPSKKLAKDAKKVEEKIQPKTPEQLQEEIIAPEIKKKAESWEKFVSTPIGKFVADIVEAGGDPIAVLQEAGQVQDYQGMPANDLMKDYFSKIEGLTGEELRAALDEHFDESLTTGNQRRRAEREARTQLDYQQQSLHNKLKADTLNNKTKGEEIHRQFASEAEDEIEDSYVKKAAYGIKLTTDQAQSLKEGTLNIFRRLINPDGTVNTKLAAFYTFSEQHRATLRKNDYLKGRTEGAEEALIAAHQPDRMETGISAPTKVEKETVTQQIDRNYGTSKST